MKTDAKYAAMTLPSVGQCLVDDTHAVMDLAYFKALLTYETSWPSGVYFGKRWKRSHCTNGQWRMLEYAEHPDPQLARTISRIILLVDGELPPPFRQPRRTAIYPDHIAAGH